MPVYSRHYNYRQLAILTTEEEYADIAACAKAYGTTMANLVRMGLEPLMTPQGYAPLRVRQGGGGRPVTSRPPSLRDIPQDGDDVSTPSPRGAYGRAQRMRAIGVDLEQYEKDLERTKYVDPKAKKVYW